MSKKHAGSIRERRKDRIYSNRLSPPRWMDALDGLLFSLRFLDSRPGGLGRWSSGCSMLNRAARGPRIGVAWTLATWKQSRKQSRLAGPGFRCSLWLQIVSIVVVTGMAVFVDNGMGAYLSVLSFELSRSPPPHGLSTLGIGCESPLLCQPRLCLRSILQQASSGVVLCSLTGPCSLVLHGACRHPCSTPYTRA